jgi:hypothetical protein
MVKNNHESVINPNDLPTSLQPSCDVPEIIPIITYHDLQKNIDEILNALCKKSSSCDIECRFKDFVNFD